ncbi:MAG: sigma-54-dependent Fis family transcriptional regulator [Betaproteobacteria bacterium]|nr:sigma-54-dependent Fis family transcriptional regulator [Betaproteobacteria bacterium]
MATEKPSLCLIEDDPIMGESLCDRFELEGFAFDWHRKAEDALRAIGAKRYACVISDIRLPDLGGDEMFAQLVKSGRPLPPFIFITGFGAIDRAVQLLKMGAADYITKPFDLDQLIEKVRALHRQAAAAGAAGSPALGISPVMRRLEETLPRLAKHASAILLSGESGVGKEHVAEQIHRHARDLETCPFVPVNCGALPESLMEAELFGYEKGAFTGAVKAKRGYFEQAHCGTLFLDEIGEMPLAMQVKLLRAVQEYRITRVGAEAPIAVDFRLVCATNRDLRQMVEQGEFREDLFYRIDVIHLKIPPLRERREDVLWFAQQFLDEFSRKEQGSRRHLSAAAEQALVNYPWPGNIRELRHCVERACILSPDPVLGPDALFEAPLKVADLGKLATSTLNDYLQECERNYISRALERHGRHMGQTAAELGISRKSLWEKLKKLGIKGPVPDPETGR